MALKILKCGLVALVVLGTASCGDRMLPSDSEGARFANRRGDGGNDDTSNPVVGDAIPASTTPTGSPPAMPPPAGVGPACWAGQLPAEVQPLRPKLAAVDACKVAADPATVWTDPGAGMVPTVGSDSDARASIVGRWVSCGRGGLTALPHAGIEFGANGRWRLLTTDASGALQPTASSAAGTRGRFYALGSGQLDVLGEGISEGLTIFHLEFAAGMDAVRLGGNFAGPTAAGDYARVEASPQNGLDNLPSITDGRCSLVGTWDMPANTVTPVVPAASISFDALGNFVGGPRGSNLCAAHTMYGTYRLSSGLFQLTSNVGMGLCHWWFDAAYPATFDASCTQVKLTQAYDNCTGGRGYLNGQTTLTKHP